MLKFLGVVLWQNADFQKTIYSARLTSMAFPSQCSSAGNAAGEKYVKDNISGASPTKENEDKKCNNRFVKLDLSDSMSIHAKLVVNFSSKFHELSYCTLFNYMHTSSSNLKSRIAS